MIRTFAVTAAALVAIVALTASQPGTATYDLVIASGRVIDPESGLDDVRYLGITGPTVRAVSATPLTGRTVLNAGGLVVAPGSIETRIESALMTIGSTFLIPLLILALAGDR